MEELEALRPSENVAESLLSRIGGKVWGVVSDPNVVRGFVDLFKIKDLSKRGRLLDERQQELTKRCASIRSEIQKYIQLIRNQQPTERLTAKRKRAPQSNTFQPRTDWSAQDQVVFKDLPAEETGCPRKIRKALKTSLRRLH